MRSPRRIRRSDPDGPGLDRVPERVFRFDAVVFDLDGTLVATDRFWLQAARAGARRAFAELGIDREPPTAEQWMSLVGLPIDAGFDRLFPDLSPAARARVREACGEEEARMLRGGGAVAMPEALGVLRRLAADGVRIGLASNCGRDYLEHMQDALGLRPLVEGARCLDSPGIADKGDMVASLLEAFATRSAVMVGDRAGDRDAAWENGIPHVHCAFGFAPAGETVEAEARIGELADLADVLAVRGRWIRSALERLGALGPDPRPLAAGVTGVRAAGKTLFARDAAAILRESGRPAVAVDLGLFSTPGATAPGDDPLGRGYDLTALERELLAPHARGEAVRLARGLPDPYGNRWPVELRVEPGAVLLLEGPYLLDPRLRPRLGRVVHLEASDEVACRRIAGREGRALGLDPVLAARTRDLPAMRRHEARHPPRAADLRLSGENPLGAGPLGGAATLDPLAPLDPLERDGDSGLS